jgi:hypothetical protein
MAVAPSGYLHSIESAQFVLDYKNLLTTLEIRRGKVPPNTTLNMHEEGIVQSLMDQGHYAEARVALAQFVPGMIYPKGPGCGRPRAEYQKFNSMYAKCIEETKALTDEQLDKEVKRFLTGSTVVKPFEGGYGSESSFTNQGFAGDLFPGDTEGLLVR